MWIQNSQSFFYARDISKEGGTDIKDSLLAKDVIWYCQKSYGYHFDNDDFFQDKNAMRPMFGDMKPDEIKKLVLWSKWKCYLSTWYYSYNWAESTISTHIFDFEKELSGNQL